MELEVLEKDIGPDRCRLAEPTSIVDASQGHRRISREEHYLTAEMELLTHMSLLMFRRVELLLSFDTEVDLNAEY